MGVFNADDGMIGSRDPEWLQGSINVIIEIFRRFGLMSNVAKSKTMTFQPGSICTGVSEEAFSQRSTREGATYKKHLQQSILCPDCGV